MTFVSFRRGLRLAVAALLAAGGAYVVLWRRAQGPTRYGWLLTLATFAGAALAAMLISSVVAAVRGPRRSSPVAEATCALGGLLLLAGGLINVTAGIYGAVVVLEREPVRLDRREELAAYQAGPLASQRDLEITLALDRLRLAAADGDRFTATSALKVLDASGTEKGLVVSPGKNASFGAFEFLQGTFGFAPKVVVMRGTSRVLDTYVPFRTMREGADGVAFLEDFEVGGERLLVHGAITLEDLSDDMKGHPALELAVEQDGAPLGRGKLRPGEFVDLERGLRVGFGGMKRWSEIMFTRHRYPRTVRTGVALIALGGLAWAALEAYTGLTTLLRRRRS